MVLTARAQTAAPFGNVPLYFEAGSPTRFLARGSDAQFLIAPTEAQFTLCKSADKAATLRMQFIGANPQAQISGDAKLSGKINYFVGSNPAHWRSGIPTFAKVRVTDIYPGIGLVYYGNQQRLEYDFDIAPGANPDAIVIRFDGADKISVNARGELVLALADGEIRQPKPLIYQMAGGVREEISGGYKILGAHTVGFAAGNYNRNLPLVIDPILSYSTYFGGNNGDTAWSVKVDNSGCVYIAGETLSTKFATNSRPNGYQTNFAGGTLNGDAFVAKFGNLGTNLIYLTYLGGSSDDGAVDLAVDGAGHAFVTGYTDSTNFPITTNAFQPKIGGMNVVNNGHTYGYNADAFVTELETNGSQLIYSTYLGGGGLDAGRGIALDAADNAYVTGLTVSTNFPTTTNAFQLHLACTNSIFNGNAFVSVLSAGGSNLIYSSYFGGTNYDCSGGIAVDSAGYVYVAGTTDSTNFPTTTNALFHHLNRFTYGSPSQTFNFDAFVAKFMPLPNCSNLVYSTYLGGTNYDAASRIACDAAGSAYVVGATTSSDFPNTATNIFVNYLTNNLNFTYPVTTNVFLTKITNGATVGIAYSAVFGGNSMDLGYDVALDPAGDAFVTGVAGSTNFPTANTAGFLSATNSGGSDAFVTAINTNASALLYSTYLGGSTNDYGYGIAVDPAGNAYVVGQTISTNFPALDAFHSTLHGTNDAFLTKILLASQPTLTIAPADTNNVTLVWSAFQPEYILESNTNLTSTNTWTTVPQPPVSSNGWNTVTLPSTNDDLFFRLHKF